MIQEINIINNKRVAKLTVDESSRSVSYIYVDTYDNRSNVKSHKDVDHSFKFMRSELSAKEYGSHSDFFILGSQLKMKNERIVNLFIVTVVYDDRTSESIIMYDLNELYCLRMTYLRQNPQCQPHNIQQLTVLMFRESLLRNALAVRDLDCALMFYSDIFRNIKSTSSSINSAYNYFNYGNEYGK